VSSQESGIWSNFRRFIGQGGSFGVGDRDRFIQWRDVSGAGGVADVCESDTYGGGEYRRFAGTESLSEYHPLGNLDLSSACLPLKDDEDEAEEIECTLAPKGMVGSSWVLPPDRRDSVTDQCSNIGPCRLEE